jgi:hypothetical protein
MHLGHAARQLCSQVSHRSSLRGLDNVDPAERWNPAPQVVKPYRRPSMTRGAAAADQVGKL